MSDASNSWKLIHFHLSIRRSLLSRDAKGRVCAGLYFPVSPNGGDAQLTLFYDGANDASIKVKQKFSIFKDESMVRVSGSSEKNILIHFIYLIRSRTLSWIIWSN